MRDIVSFFWFLSHLLLLTCKSCQSDKEVPLFDLSARDTALSPQDNVLEYANGPLLKNAKIPADKVGAGSFFDVDELLNGHIKGILDSCADLKNPKAGTPAQQIGALYLAAMDSAAIDKAGLHPLKA